MKTLSKNTSRFLSIASMSMLLVFSLSCKKDEAEPNPTGDEGSNGGGNNNSSLIASSNLEFVDLGKDIDFKCYDKNPSVDHIKIRNDTLFMIFGNNQTVEGDTIVFQVMVSSVTDLNVGDTYSITNSSGRTVALSIYSNNAPELAYNAISDLPAPYSNSGELKITSKNGKNVKGTFYFSGYTSPNPLNPTAPQKEVIVTNGKIDCEYVIE